MSYEIRRVFAVYPTINEYGHLVKCAGYYSTEGEAKRAAHGIGWYGANGRVIETPIITVPNAPHIEPLTFVLEDRNPIQVKEFFVPSDPQKAAAERGLRKLTDEERLALGL